MERNTEFEWENVDIDGSFNVSGVASTESSFKDGFKGSNYSFEGFGSFPDSYNKKDSSVCSSETFIGLKLGKRTYFENGYTTTTTNNNNKKTVVLDTRKKVKSTCQSALISRCQVEGCNLDLSSSKEYHRKHRVCEKHSKCPKVIVAGVERRFCQQCSRFHSMSEFDNEKRSCRKRLSDHNARRRKSQQDPICFNSTSPFSSFYGSESDDVQSHSTGVHMSNVLNMCTPPRNWLVPSKGPRSETFDHGFKESLPSNVDAVEIRRALSLLSTNTWGSYELDHHLMDSNDPTMVQHGLHVGPHDSSLSPQVYWQPNQQSIDPRIQIFKSSYENSFLFHHNH